MQDMAPHRRWLVASGLASIAVVYLMLTGMIETFGERQIILGLVSLGQIVLYLPALVPGFLLRQDDQPVAARVLYGALIGLATFVVPALLLILMDSIPMRDMFQNASPALIAIMTFDQASLPAGLALLGLAGIVSGGIGAALALLSPSVRKALVTGFAVVILVAMLSDLVGQVLRQMLGGRPERVLFSGNALRPGVGTWLFVLTGALAYLKARFGPQLQDRFPALSRVRSRRGQLATNGLGVVLLLILPWMLGSYLSEVLVNVGLFMLMALGLNIAVGLAGLLDLGYVTNFAVGAYLVGVLTSTGPQGVGQFNFWLILPISIVAAMFTGFLLALPVIRMRGDYLAIATLGFGEMIRLLALSDWFAPLIGGAQGVLFIPKPHILTLSFQTPQQLYYIILAACLLVLLVSYRLDLSRTGRRWMAIREDETVANAIGIDTTWVKTLAFTLSAASGGLSGAIFAAKLGTIFPHSFQLLISINALCIILVGGMASIPGIALGSIVLIGMPELLREFSEYRYLFYGILLVLMTLFRPRGLIPTAVRHYTASEADAGRAPPSAPEDAALQKA